ncbi:hypothetical protein QVD17_22591 [Tagetes erecta]|uniref:Uncharacterized protein n=1 Tax=Tagetes erecta TaxID=13708 RepID=A0AAD8KI08_TARER|nr:hypothetical protein QVD17_22591 [Tagetes erecta]
MAPLQNLTRYILKFQTLKLPLHSSIHSFPFTFLSHRSHLSPITIHFFFFFFFNGFNKSTSSQSFYFLHISKVPASSKASNSSSGGDTNNAFGHLRSSKFLEDDMCYRFSIYVPPPTTMKVVDA